MTIMKRIGMSIAVVFMVVAVCYFGMKNNPQQFYENDVYRVEIPATMTMEEISPSNLRFVYDSENYIDIAVIADKSFKEMCTEYEQNWSAKNSYFSCENQFGAQLIDDMIFVFYDDNIYHQATCVPYMDGVLVLESQSTFENDDSENSAYRSKEYEKTAAFETVFDTIELVDEDGVFDL